MTKIAKNVSSCDRVITEILEMGGQQSMITTKMPLERMVLSKDYHRIATVMEECGGYTGHCGCLNNACMLCTCNH